MQKIKQTIILSGNGNEMATLQLEKKLNQTYVTLKVYNTKLSGDLILGLSSNGSEVLKKEVSFENTNTYNFKTKSLENFDDISCIIVEKLDNKINPILWGKNKKFKDKILQEFNDCYLNKTVESNKEEKLFDYDEVEVENIINEEMKDFDEIKTQSNDEENSIIENEIQENEEKIDDVIKEENKKLKDFNGTEFFNLIAEQIDDLFESYPRENNLEELLPNSKWVKIDFENNGNEYVLGLIYDEFDLKYICYGLPGKFSSNPPKNLGECQWLPINPKEPSDGYWIIYQDAFTGEKVDIV